MKRYASAFIAFSSNDKRKADSVYQKLQTLGLSESDIHHFIYSEQKVSEDAGANVRGEIRGKDALVLVYSKSSEKSQWVHHELSVASGLEKPIFLVKSSHNLVVKLHDSMKEYVHLKMVNGVDELALHFEGKHKKLPKSKVLPLSDDRMT